jgi:hypothetical protein
VNNIEIHCLCIWRYHEEMHWKLMNNRGAGL